MREQFNKMDYSDLVKDVLSKASPTVTRSRPLSNITPRELLTMVYVPDMIMNSWLFMAQTMRERNPGRLMISGRRVDYPIAFSATLCLC